MPITNPIVKGSIVKVAGRGHMVVRAVFKNSVNLGPVFGSKTTAKKVPLSDVFEDHDNWYQGWTQSETYRCM